MYESYRVRRKFQWRGWQYAPPGACTCQCSQEQTSHCTGQTATGCACSDKGYCSCGIPPEQYAGDVLIVEAGHPRKVYLLERRFVTYDPSLLSGDELVLLPQYERLVKGEMAVPTVAGGPRRKS